MSVLYGYDGIRHRLADSEAALLVTDAENAPRFDGPVGRLVGLSGKCFSGRRA